MDRPLFFGRSRPSPISATPAIGQEQLAAELR